MMDKKSFGAVVLSIFVFTAYSYYLQVKYPDYYAGKAVESVAEENNVTPIVEKTTKATTASKEEPVSTHTKLSSAELTFENEDSKIVFDQYTSAIKTVVLKKFSSEFKGSDKVSLLDKPIKIQALDSFSAKANGDYSAAKVAGGVEFSKTLDGVRYSQVFVPAKDGYGLDLFLKFKNISSEAKLISPSASFEGDIEALKSSGSFLSRSMDSKGFLYSKDGSREEETVKGFCSDESSNLYNEKAADFQFFGVDEHYFLQVFQAAEGEKLNYRLDRLSRSSEEGCQFRFVAARPSQSLKPGEEVKLAFSGFLGPKKIDILNAYNPKLKQTIKFGWFALIAEPLLWGLKGLYKYVNNYGIAIIIITLLLKLLLFPLTKSSVLSMKKMQKLNPQMNKIREKYKNDPQRQQKEIMAFMGKHKINPMKGCVPVLAQTPVFIAFYNVLSQAIELRHAPFFFWIQDLSVADPYYVTPVLMGAGMFFQQKLTPNASMDPNQEKVMMMMPIMFSVMMISLPAGMVLYMLTNTIVSIVQQQVLNKKFENIV